MAKPTSSDITLLEKTHMLIKALTSKIASFPYDDPRKKAKDQHLLASGHEFVAKHLEADRINTLIAKHEEQYPPNTIPCPICLEDVKVLSMYSAQYYICCGQSVCFPCGQSEGGLEMKTCPMCRAPNNMITRKSDDEAIHSASLLKVNELAFLKRSNGLWTTAILADRSLQPTKQKARPFGTLVFRV